MRIKFTKKLLESIEAADKRQSFYDEMFPGFALLVTKAGAKTFYYTYRIGKGRSAEKKWVMLGAFPALTVEQARQKAKDMAASVQRGIDPAEEVKENKSAPFMRDALQAFSEEHFPKIKPATVISYKKSINYILPRLGKLRVKDVGHSHVARFHQDMGDTPYAGNRALGMLSVFFGWCERHGYRERNTNPCDGVTKFKEHKRMDFMGATELTILGNTLARMEQTWLERQQTKVRRTGELVDAITPQAAAAIRLLMLTGARVGEILSLEWSRVDMDLGVARLPDSKTGFKVLQLPAAAVAVLNGLPRFSEWVFPAASASGHMVNIKDAWGDVLKQSGLTGWRIHDLRHAFASMMVNSGASLPIVGKILGHTQASTTQRYAHLEENPARKAAEAAAARIAEAMSKPSGNVIHFAKTGEAGA